MHLISIFRQSDIEFITNKNYFIVFSSLGAQEINFFIEKIEFMFDDFEQNLFDKHE